MSILKILSKTGVAGLLIALFAGCGAGNDSSAGEGVQVAPVPGSTTGSKPDLVADDRLEPKLLGVWLGEAVLDEALVEEKLQSMPAERQQLILSRARSFLSTIMAIEFRADGTMENEIALVPVGGQQLRDGCTGKWRVIERKLDQLIVETTERAADGSTVTNQRLYQIAPDGNQVALMVPMNDELGECNPMILFTRQQLSDTNVARQPSSVRVQ